MISLDAIIWVLYKYSYHSALAEGGRRLEEQMAYTLNRDAVTDAFREAVLEALDTTAKEIFFDAKFGATDADLPRIFKAIDAQIETLCERYGVVLVGYEVKAA